MPAACKVSSMWLWLVYLLHTIGERSDKPRRPQRFTKLARRAWADGLIEGSVRPRLHLPHYSVDYLGGASAATPLVFPPTNPSRSPRCSEQCRVLTSCSAGAAAVFVKR